MCKYIREWIYAKQIAPRDTRGALGEVLGGQQFKSLGKLSDCYQLWFTSADSSGNGHRLNPSRPSIPQGHFGGGVGGHTLKSLGICQTAAPIGTELGIGESIYDQKPPNHKQIDTKGFLTDFGRNGRVK